MAFSSIDKITGKPISFTNCCGDTVYLSPEDRLSMHTISTRCDLCTSADLCEIGNVTPGSTTCINIRESETQKFS